MSDDTTNAAATDNVFTLAKLEEAMAKIRALGPLPPVIRESAFLTERHEDWSRVRSPGRAARRLQQGQVPRPSCAPLTARPSPKHRSSPSADVWRVAA